MLGNFGIDYTNLYPKSYVRDSNKTTPFGNVSQTFNLFIPYNKEGDKYKKIKDVIANGEYDEE